MKKTRFCVICNKEFPADRNKKTCSRECSLELRKINSRLGVKRYYDNHKNDAEYKNKKKEQVKRYRRKKAIEKEGVCNDY